MNNTQSANPNATNSELDARRIVPFKQLTNSQRDELIGEYVEIVVESMSTESLVEYVQWKLAEDYDRLSDYELKYAIVEEHNEGLYDELVNNVTS